MDEFALIEILVEHQAVHRGDVVLGIGDDAAVVRPEDGRELVVTTDVLVNGVHFPESTEPAAVGYKSLAVSLSDVAAMGATPLWATLCLTMPDANEVWIKEFGTGFFELAAEHGVQLIGGDTASGPLSIAVQVTGAVGDAGYLSRDGAGEDDLIYVSGTLGDAALGLQVVSGALSVSESDGSYFVDRLNRPSPRVALGRAVLSCASAAIDISDGLVADLGHICRRSGVGAVVDVSRVPLSDGYRRCLPRVGWQPATGFGDDYELCFTVPPDRAPTVERVGTELGLSVTCIGHITRHDLKWTYGEQPFPIHEQGYQHFR